MGRPKGSKNKSKTAPPKAKAKAKTKAKSPQKAETPDWLRKAMAVKPTKPKVGRKPNALKEKFKAIAKKGRRHMTISKDKPLADPMDDPDLRAGEKGDLPTGPDLKPPGGYDKPDQGLPGRPGAKPGHDLPRRGLKPRAEGERGEIDDDKVKNVIADTLGGSGDQHSRAQQILDRFGEAGWIITAGEGEPSEPIQVILDSTEEAARQSAEAKAREKREAEAAEQTEGDWPEALRQETEAGGTTERRTNDPKGADAGKGRSKDDPKGADDGKRSKA